MPLIIDDSNYLQFQDPTIGGEHKSRGLNPRNLHPTFGSPMSSPSAAESGLILIPMEQWPDKIADKERNKATLKYLWKQSPIGILNQNGLSYCHAFSPAWAIMLYRELMGLPYVELSASSIGGPVTGFRNAGAWIVDDLEQIVKVGCATTDFVPMRQVSKSGYKSGWEANAALHKVLGYKELQSRNFVEHGSALLQDKPVCVGLNYWGHAVTDIVLVDLDPSKKATDASRYGVEFANSWDVDFGDGGFGIRAGSKKYADEAYIVDQIVAA